MLAANGCAVIFITDGLPNGDNNSIRAKANALRAQGATVYAVGIQTSASDARIYLNQIAGYTDGATDTPNVHEIDTPEELEPVIASIVDNIVGAGTDAVFTDVRDSHHNTKDGLHTASLGGAYLTALLGFAGEQLRHAEPSAEPTREDVERLLAELMRGEEEA